MRIEGVNPMISHGGLCRLTILAVPPLLVMEMIVEAFMSRATETAAPLTASGIPETLAML